ncbi:hypothetical protein GH714_012455 [Hevea brasiliensis]|uniref:Disease resistance protein At4g27190-like leucine-rich repeats domain-containing protein n=1 Tax=Hevea brasiliensis TaxID=3981 RepID=A0A6A6L2E6_HEVBR|nr:hypothetical protein GH714_012455 [Hevea brasiliensis]
MSPNLEELTLEHKDLIAIQHGQFSFQHFSKLKVLTLSNLQNRSQLFLIGFLKTVHYVETIVVESSNLEELFSCEGFTLVRNLELFTVDFLKQIWDQDSRLKPVLQHLETLSVRRCNSLINIVPSSSSFPNLATLVVGYCEGLKTYFQASKFPALWHGGIQGRLFYNVQSLTVDQCAISDIPVPANLLQFLNKLESLQVEYCDSAKIVFDLEGLSVDDGHTKLLPQLSILHLANMAMLRHLWNKDPLGILEFNKLRLLRVENCNRLKNIFTWSTALCLMQLEEIKLSNCNTIEEIIEKEGPEEATSSADKMILPSLKFIDLECLPKFSSFYSGSSNLECLSLKKLSIYECPSMKNVFGTLLRLHRPNTNDEGREQRLDNEGFDTPLTTPFYHKVAFEGIYDVQLSNFPMLKEKWHGQFPFKNLKHLRKDFLKCPSLKRIDMVGCPNMELLASKFCEDQDLSMIAEGNEEGIHNGDFVFSIAASSGGKVAIPSLEE